MNRVADDFIPTSRPHPPAPHGDPEPATGHGATWVLVVSGLIVAGLTLWVLVYPFNFQGRAVNAWLGDTHVGKLNTMANVALFVPYGLVWAWLGVLFFPGRRWLVIGLVMADGLLFSLFVETIQVWLPQRFSSVVDIAANGSGALIGACLGWRYAAVLGRRLDGLLNWLALRPAAKRALLILGLVVIARAAPFDLSPETLYLRLSLYDSHNSGWPLSAVGAWWADTTGHATIRNAAIAEAGRATTNLLLFMAATIALARAVQESGRRYGQRRVPLESIAFVGVALVLGTELLQWPIRSRVMDTTDAAAGLAGVVLGVLLEALAYGVSRLGSGRG